MTINGVQNVVLEVLSTQDIISLSEVQLLIRDSIKDRNLSEKLINLAMEELIKMDLVKVLDKDYWVLTKPMTAFSQTIKISGPLSCSIASVLNKAASFVTNEKTELCNSMSITEDDIETLVLIADNINKREDEFPEESDGSDEFKLPS